MNTLPRLLQHQALRHPRKPALRIKDLGIWSTRSWYEVLDAVRGIAGGLNQVGVKSGDMVAVIGNNTPDMYCAITACQSLGAIPAIIYANIIGSDLEQILSSIDVKFVIAEDQQQVDAILASHDHLPKLQKIIYSTERGLSQYDPEMTVSFAKVQELGKSWLTDDNFQKQVDQVKPENHALVLFSSGIMGKRKPALLTHKSLINVAKSIAKAGMVTSDDEYLSFMPIALPSNIVCGYVLSLQTGFCLSCPENSETVLSDLREISPSLLYGPEHVYKHIAASVHNKMDHATGLSNWCYEHYLRDRKSKSRSWMSELLVNAPVRNCYGLNRVRWALVGRSGDVSSGIMDFFRQIGIDIYSIYGTAETSGCLSLQKLGSEQSDNDVGHAVEGMNVKVDESGEILCKGASLFDGYYNDEEATREKMRDDGWYAMHDIGNVLPDGRIRIVDSKSAIGQLTNGKEFHAGVIESGIKSSLFIRDAMIIGDGQDYLVACLTLEPDLVGTWADTNNLRYTGFNELAAHPEVGSRLIGEELAKINSSIDPKQPKIKTYFILHRQFSPTVGEVTWSYKPNRKKLRHNLKEVFDAAFGGKSEVRFFDPIDDNEVEIKVYKLNNQ